MEFNEEEFKKKCEELKLEMLSGLTFNFLEDKYVQLINDEYQKRLSSYTSPEDRKLLITAYKELRKMSYEEASKINTKLYFNSQTSWNIENEVNLWVIPNNLSLRKKIFYPERFYEFLAFNPSGNVLYKMINRFEYNGDTYCYLTELAVNYYTVNSTTNFYKFIMEEDETKDRLEKITDEDSIKELKKHFSRIENLF